MTYLCHVAKQLGPSTPLFSHSVGVWRRRLAQLTMHLTGHEKLILPSSLRPGAATHFFELWGENLPRLLWRGRWASQRTLEHYVQEIVSAQVLMRVETSKVEKIHKLSNMFVEVLRGSKAQEQR